MTRLLLLRVMVSLVTFHAFYCASITMVVDNYFGSPWGSLLDGYENDTVELWRFIRNGTGLMNINSRDLRMYCAADVPIKWKWTEDGVRRLM
jgi:hypothetical protein